eukprot:scaffold6927_cov167-Ochromonas_danica.AAC.1
MKVLIQNTKDNANAIGNSKWSSQIFEELSEYDESESKGLCDKPVECCRPHRAAQSLLIPPSLGKRQHSCAPIASISGLKVQIRQV